MESTRTFLFLKRSLVVFVTSLLLIANHIPTIYAQENQAEGLSLTVSPYLLDLKGKPGETLTDTIRIRNNLSQDLSLVSNVRPLRVEGERGGAIPSEEVKPEDTHIGWLKVDSDKITAKSQEWTEIPITITIPQDAAFGYYFAVTFSPATLPNPEETGAQAIVKGEVAIFVLLNVEKEGAKAGFNLLSFKPLQNIFEHLPAKFETRVENTGNIHLRPHGNIFIRQFGSKDDLAILEVNESNGNVLPGTKRVFETSWKDGFVVKNEETGKLEFHWDKLTQIRFGQYEARLALVYFDGTRDVLLESSQKFWIIPYTAIAITVGSIIALIVIFRWLLKKYIQNQMKKLGTVPQDLKLRK